jgi:hypothetical protein
MKYHNLSQANKPGETIPDHLRRFATLIETDVKSGKIQDISFSPSSHERYDPQFEATVHYSDDHGALPEDMSRVKIITRNPNNIIAVRQALSMVIEWIDEHPDQRIYDLVMKQGFDNDINEVVELDIYYDIETVDA